MRETSMAEPAFLSGEGEMAGLLQAHDWSRSPLGEPATWPATLRAMLRVALSTRHPVFIFWGPRYLCFYNDAYRAFLGPEKHPAMLGGEAQVFWSETWPIIAPQLGQVMGGGRSTWHENQLVPYMRNGKLQDAYWTYSFAPIDDENAPNGIGGVLVLCTETTAQVMSARNLALERDRFNQLFEQAPSFMTMLRGPRHVVEMVNPGYTRLIGNRQVLGLPIEEALPEAAAQGYVQLLDEVYASGKAYSASGAKYEMAAEPPGRSVTRYLDFVYQPILEANGSVSGIFVEGVDVTERRTAELALALSEEQLRLATEAGDIGLWDVDLVNDRLYWPTRVKAMFGISADVPVSMADFYDGLHPEDRPGTSAAFAESLDPTKRSIYDVEFRTIGKEDGKQRYVAARGRGIFDPDGRCVRAIGTAIDITRRKKIEADLKELNATLERRVAESLAERNVLASIVEGTTAFVQVVDLDYRWLAINRASAREFERIYGYLPKVGQCMLQVLADYPQHVEAVKAVWSRALAGEEFTEIGEFGDPGRERRHYEMRFNTLRDAAGKQLGAYQFVYDVTEQVLAQQRLAQAEFALQQARKMEAIGQLTGGVAHDFNNLLQAVRGNLELIQRKPHEADRVRLLAERGIDATRRGAKLTAQLLTFSREQSPELQPVSLARLLRDMEHLLRTALGPTHRLTIELEPGELSVIADKTQLEMAILNLTVNARDAMEEAGELTLVGKTVSVSDDLILAAGEYVELTVADTGPGMPAEVRTRAFDPFFTTKPVGKGSGLGLSQVYGMAHRARGAARIESRLGEGTSVVLLMRRSAEQEFDSGPAPLASGDKRRDASRTKVLVVDDDDDVRRILVDALASLGYQVIEARGGREGLDMLENSEPDAIVVDFAMPDINGAEVAREARALYPAMPVLMVSGFSDSEAIEAALGTSIPLLRKPFDISTLQASFEHALSANADKR